MTKIRTDYGIRPNNQTNRENQNLWDVIEAGKTLITIAKSEEQAQAIADRLNLDPYALDRGQTRLDRGGSKNYERRDP